MKVVAPVKFNARYAVTGVKIKRYVNAQPALCHKTISGLPKNSIMAKGNAINAPSIKPFVLKCGEGIQGSRIGNRTTPAMKAAAIARAGNNPLIKYSGIAKTRINKST